MLNMLRVQYNKFPPKFWILVLAVFIDMIGGTLLSPFFALYITQKFQVGMTQAGVLLGIFSFSGLLGSTVGGALTDKFGRKKIVIFGLIFSALSTITLGLVNQLSIIYPLAVLIGILGSIAGPAHNAMVADMLPEEKRNEGFGLMRVAANLSWIIGPTIGGFVASRSYLMLFILDAVFSITTAMVVIKFIPETKPVPHEHQASESVWQTILGYRIVFKDMAFIAFLLVSMLMLIVYQQLYNTLSVYMRDTHHFPTQFYGYMLSASAVLVVIAQLWLTRKTSKYPPLLMMALGTFFYMIGFSMFGIFAAYAFFVLAVLIITIGEMIAVPASQVLAAKFAPEVMRGRYMAIFGLSWSIPSTIGPAAAGIIMDNYDPRWVWYLGGLLCLISILGYYLLHLRLKNHVRFARQTDPASAISTEE